MSNTIDLQIQSNKSDGKYSPAELVRLADALGLKTIALTDHDTVEGTMEAVTEGKNAGIKVIPGIEISCSFLEHEIHMLGFGIDIRDQNLNVFLKEAQDDRKRRTEKIVDRLQEAGFKISFEDVKKETDGVVARPHIALAALHNPENKEKLGAINTIREFINEYLVQGKPTYVERKKNETKDVIGLIHSAGGAAVWSHPTISIKNDFKMVEDVLKVFISYDIDGIETSAFAEDDAEFLNGVSGKYGLLRTAGSDFHREPEPGKETEGGKTLGDYPTYGYDLSDIVPKLEAAILKRRITADNTVKNLP